MIYIDSKGNKMTLTSHYFCVFLVLSFLSLSTLAKQSLPAETSQLSDNIAKIEHAKILNFVSHDGHVYSAGQPSKEALKMLAESGIKHIINLRSPDEQTWDENDLVNGLGMTYHAMPIANAGEVNSENAAKLSDLLNRLKGEGVLVHCASSNRVGALIAISAHLKGLKTEAAIDEGKRWGLKSLEPVAQSVINNQN